MCKNFFSVLAFCLLFVSCKKTEDSVTELADNLLVLRTDQVVDITGNSALGEGYIKVNGSTSVLEYGFCWSTSPNPTITASKNIYSGYLSSFSCPITGLSLGTTYYLRSYATINRSAGSFGYFTAYGNQVQFTTSASGLPTLTTKGVSVSGGTSASSGGEISNTGGSAITARGVCWSTNPNPTILLNPKTTNGTGAGSFTSDLNNLIPNTQYYVKAYATNSAGTAYGNELSFSIGLPTISTTGVSSITGISAVSGGNITNSGSTSVTSRGVVWSTSPNPTVLLSTKTINGAGSGSFTSNLTNLTPNTQYYVRAYATNNSGTGYGSNQTFNTLSSCSVPLLSTTPASSVTGTTAFSGGTNLSVSTGCNINAKGVCWSTSPNPTVSLSTKTNIGTGSGSFTSNITGLIAGTVYYVRAYATNSAGTGYGTNQTFNTLSNCTGAPSLSTTFPGSVTGTTAISGGTNISVGTGCTITAKGVCWSTSPNPTISLTTKTNNGSGTSAYFSNISGLSSNTTYYVRAYATNSGGFTGYGPIYSFTTSGTSSSFITIGSGTNSTNSMSNQASSYINPFSTYYEDAKHQYLLKASEIIGSGGSTSGFTISNIGFYILGNSTHPINGLTVKLKSVPSGTTMPVTSGFSTVWTGSFSSGLPAAIPYWTTFGTGFTSFYWNGTSDLVVEICFDNSSWTNNYSHVQYSTTTFISNWYQCIDGGTGCAISLSATNSNASRPNIRLHY